MQASVGLVIIFDAQLTGTGNLIPSSKSQSSGIKYTTQHSFTLLRFHVVNRMYVYLPFQPLTTLPSQIFIVKTQTSLKTARLSGELRYYL